MLPSRHPGMDHEPRSDVHGPDASIIPSSAQCFSERGSFPERGKRLMASPCYFCEASAPHLITHGLLLRPLANKVIAQ